MARSIEILTPESVPLTLEPAGIGTRFGAILVDIVIQLGVAVGGITLAAILSAFVGWTGGSAVFDLAASSVRNPFTLAALRSFRCPAKL